MPTTIEEEIKKYDGAQHNETNESVNHFRKVVNNHDKKKAQKLAEEQLRKEQDMIALA